MVWALAALGGGELLVWAAFAAGTVTGATASCCHGLMALAAAMALLRRGGTDAWHLVVALLAIAAGPIGAFAAAALVGARLPRPGTLASDRHWLDLVSGTTLTDPAGDLALRIRSGQALEGRRAPLKPFEEVLGQGTMRDQQVMIGRVTQSYDASLEHLLAAGVRSPNPWIRVQAATAYTALRNRERTSLARSTCGTGDHTALPLAELTRLATSTLVGEHERHALHSEVLERIEAELGGSTADRRRADRARILARAGLLREAALLIERGDIETTGASGAAP